MGAETALAEFRQPSNLTILTLSAPYLSPNPEGPSSKDLALDLTHYRDLFSKLRFSYVEQVTKERFLRSITVEQPEFVDPAEHAALHEQLAVDKAALKERKSEVRGIVEALEEQGRQLAGRYERVELHRTQLERLPEEIAHLEATIAHLRQTSHSSSSHNSDDPALSLPLQPTLDLLSDREDDLASIDAQIAALQDALPGKQAEVEQLRDEVSITNARKTKAVEEAKEARRRRANGGVGDEMEERGRWLRGVETGLRTMLEV